MSHRIIEAILNSQYSQLLLFMRHNYNFKIKSNSHNILMISLDIKDPKRRFKMFKFLLQQNLIDLLDTDKNGQNIFFHCVIRELDTEFDYLLKNYITDLDLTKTDHFGKTLLHYAVINNNLKILKNILNTCSKYKINVDIPDKINKITPYLLACRLNYFESADLILKIGNASKNQADQTSFFDAEQWTKEGQMELFKNYLKINEIEINNAKMKGKLRIFNELKQLSDSLDTEVEKNPDILPAIAQVINEHKLYELNTMKKSICMSTIPLIKIRKNSPEINNEGFFKRNSTSSENSYLPSTTSSSALSNYSKVQHFPKTMRPKPEINFLIELTGNTIRADNYVSSKSESELKTSESSARSTASSSIRRSFNTNLNLHHMESHMNHSARSFDLSDLFNVVSAQNTDSYRKTVKYVAEPPILTVRRNSRQKPKPKCISTFKLITINEESKINNSFRKLTNSKIKITT
ncbi:unnamed protein product [Brachionus calyciflorus]|uniref:Uncharacterized protein n=1 Tax=Brachionus calyciflorus TaxID=104777 RepID=A0A813TU37_9BILA|nr:unnamed protein product [Brachionus calyciflorus]